MSELQAGRELDALIAEKVMGWTSVAMAGLFTQFPAIALCGLPPGAQLNADLQVVPRYSTQIAAAWQVVEKFKMTITPNNCHPHIKAKWCVDVELKGSHELWLAGAETAPLAICRAALRAVGQDGKGDR